jgi:enoyl-CoA hydratase/carnithine racemase
MALMSWRREGTVAIITLENGENRHNPTFVAEILATLDAIEADEGACAVVITSNDPKNWSQGIDLEWILGCVPDPARHDEIRDFMHGLDKMFARVLTFPVPVVAAMTGHTFGDGAILACCCDFRIMRADRGFFCFPEVDLNIPFLPGMTAIVQAAVPEPFCTRWVLEGRRVGGAELVQAGVAMKAVEGADAVVAEAIAYAATFGKGRNVVRVLKQRMHASILEVFTRDDTPVIAKLELMV